MPMQKLSAVQVDAPPQRAAFYRTFYADNRNNGLVENAFRQAVISAAYAKCLIRNSTGAVGQNKACTN